MPAVTRSAARRNGYRSRIEDPTPDSCITTTQRRSVRVRTAVKRKLAVSREEFDDDGPTRKKYATHLRSTTTTEKFASTCQNSGHVEKTTEDLKSREISARHFPSRIPKRCVTTRSMVNNKTNAANNLAVEGNTTKRKNRGKENISDNTDKISDESDYSSNGNNNTPGCEMNDGAAARLKTYSAICRSKKRKAKRKGQNKATEMNDKSESPKSRLSQSTQKSKEDILNQEGKNQNGCCEEDQVINKEIFNCDDEKEVDESLPVAGQDEKSYKTKYLEMVSRMKTLQEKFLEAQQNALRNIKVSDSVINQLKITLEKEIHNACSAREECQRKEKEIEKLKRTLDQQQDVSRENKDLEKTHFNDHSFDEEKLDGLQRKLKEQRAILKFYSMLTGISVKQDESHLTNSKYESFHCEYLPENSNRHAVRFRLMHDKEIDELEYCPNPKSPGSEQLMTNLPEYLQENIFFLPNQGPRFLSKLLINVEKM